jgi:tetratricopeptide (TPR) repeat protein
MNRKIILAEAIIALTIILAFKISSKPRTSEPQTTSRQQAYAGKMMMQCSPDWSLLNTDSLAVNMGVLPGWGNYHWDINSNSDSAKYYFNQGINMYYAFHIIESMASFKKAQTFDDNNAMLYWAEALAFGPNINDIEYAATPDALSAAQKALAFSQASSAKEKVLIMAMQARYSTDSTVSCTSLNEAYAREMKKAYNQFPHDADVAALYADALMLLHPWMYWKHDGKPEAWTPEIVSVLENNLKEHPLHPGANHYYIHAVEASPTPGLATKSADRLSEMMPAVSHMVHMPSHIYIRTGEYQKGIVVNEKSISGYNKYLELFPDVVRNAPLYLIHNLHMKTNCAMMEPNYAFSKKTAAECIASFDTTYLSLPQPMGNFIQYVYMIPQMVDVRYGKWEQLLSEPIMNKHYAYAHVLSLWAKGLAQANTNKLEVAKNTLIQLQEALKNPDLEIVLNPFNAAISGARVAEKILQGTIAEKSGNIKAAVSCYEEAVKLEDKLIYTEPRDWLIPSRHYLANALMQQKNIAKAKQILEEDFQQNPHNFYALSAMQKINKSATWKTQLKDAWKNADMKEARLIY